MSDEPVIWHYGLMAERWAACITDTPELPFLEKAIARYGQPVLDLACGTGRLLLPLLRAGVDVDGCDLSGDMLHFCRQQAAREGLVPNLYEQPMHALTVPRMYRTIYLCGSFGLAGSRKKDLATLRRCHAHLEGGGALLLDIEAEYASPESWAMWLEEQRRDLPQPWPEEGARRIAADGSEHVAYFRYLDFDPLEQQYTRQARLEKWQAGERVAWEVYTLRGNIYLKNEVLLMLEMAGFREVSVYGGYRDEAATAADSTLVFAATK
jgi:SAM-dependent methyltransferase